MVMRQSKALGLRGDVHLLTAYPTTTHTIAVVHGGDAHTRVVPHLPGAMPLAHVPVYELRARTLVVLPLLGAMLSACFVHVPSLLPIVGPHLAQEALTRKSNEMW